MSKVKFTVFSDLHHHPAWYKSEAPERLAAIQKRALDSGSEFLLHLGDFTHKPSAAPELIRQYLEFSLPGYFVLGNHEFDIDSYETVLRTMKMDSGYYYFDRSGFRFIVLDENYFRDSPASISIIRNAIISTIRSRATGCRRKSWNGSGKR